jgi:hypothetical protein
MKNTFLLGLIALAFSATAVAQTEPVKPQAPVEAAKTQPATPATTQTTTTGTVGSTGAVPTALVTLDSNLPEHLKGVTSSTVEPKHFLPVLGAYATADAATNVTISVDEKNLGIVWINGLPQGSIKALLKKSPATYKIPAQKTAEGKSVAEGTLVYDKDAKQLWISIGAAYNEENPTAPFTGKAKGKVWQLARADVVAPTAVETIQQ